MPAHAMEAGVLRKIPVVTGRAEEPAAQTTRGVAGV